MKQLLPGVLIAFGVGCANPEPPVERLEEALSLLRTAFETGEEDQLAGLYPEGWALLALSGENRRSVTGRVLRRRLGALFRRQAPVSWSEKPRSIRRSPDGRFVVLTAEWRSMEIGTDRPMRERFRIALELVPDARASWRLRELIAWAAD